jgi:hypothetical protein
MSVSARSTIAVEQGQRGTPRLDHVSIARLVPPREQVEPLGEYRTEPGVAGFQQAVRLENEALCLTVDVTERGADNGDLATEFGSLGSGSWAPQGVVAGEEAGGDRLVVAGVSAEPQCGFAEWPGAVTIFRDRVLEFASQRRGELRLLGQADTGHGGQRCFELLNDLVAGHRELGAESLHRQGHVGKCHGIWRRLRRLDQQAAGSVGVAGAGLVVSFVHEQPGHGVGLDAPSTVDGGEAHPAKMAGRLAERQPLAFVACRLGGPMDRPGRLDGGDGVDVVAGHVAWRHLSTAFSTAFEGGADSSVQTGTVGCVEFSVEGLAIDVVGEPELITRRSSDQSGIDRRGEVGQDCCRRRLGDRAQHVEQQPIAEHACHFEHSLALCRQGVEAPADSPSHHRRERCNVSSGPQPCEFTHEERMSTGSTVEVDSE